MSEQATAHRQDGGVPCITRKLRPFDILDAEALENIERNADRVLAQIGVSFVDNPQALVRWKAAGAEIEGDRVRLPNGMARELCATAPACFVQRARNPARSVPIGGAHLVTAPSFGAPFVRDLDGTRRYGTIGDFRNFLRMAQMSPGLHHAGGTLCEPGDVDVHHRHLDMLLALMTLSDKPYMGSVTLPERAADSVAMSRILFGEDGFTDQPAMTSLINVNSPLTFDPVMMGALEVYAGAGQAVIISPFIAAGAMAPGTVAGALTQMLAEVMAGAAYAQLVRPGAPVVFGAFVTAVEKVSGQQGYGAPEIDLITLGAGQLARRLGLPYRNAGALTGARLTDAQAGYEAAAALQSGLMAGVNFMLNACGWLEGGLVTSYEKFALDADRLCALQHLAAGVDLDAAAQAMDVIGEVGPGGHYLGIPGAAGGARLWSSDLLDASAYETWQAAGARDAASIAAARARQMLSDYEPPAIDTGVREALEDFVTRRKIELSGRTS